jgi:hypothetical protein
VDFHYYLDRLGFVGERRERFRARLDAVARAEGTYPRVRVAQIDRVADELIEPAEPDRSRGSVQPAQHKSGCSAELSVRSGGVSSPDRATE